jgi:hypothetical protein
VTTKHYSIDAVLVALAIAARVAAVLVLQSHHVPRSTYEHGEIAASLLAGRGFSTRFLGAEGPTSQQAPMYPLFVAAAYAAVGVEQPAALLLIELSQSALGGLLVLGVLQLSRHVAPGCRAAAWWAGLIAALHPSLVYAATHVQVALVAATLLVWILAWGYRAGSTGCRSDAIITGALLALLVLTDPILSLAGSGVVGAIVLGRRSQPREVRRTCWLSLTMLVAAGLGVAPWIARNALVHGEFVAVKSTFGYAFWQGNCNQSEGTDKVIRPSVERALAGGSVKEGISSLNRRIWAARHEAGYIDDIALTKGDLGLLRSVSEPERSRILFRRAIRELAEQPGRYARLCIRRFRYFWLFDETNPKTRVSIYRLSHLGLTIAAALGLVLARPDVRIRLVPTLATAATIALFHSLTIVSARFHIPIEPLLAIWAACGVTRWNRAVLPRELSAAPAHHIVGVRFVSRFRPGFVVER